MFGHGFLRNRNQTYAKLDPSVDPQRGICSLFSPLHFRTAAPMKLGNKPLNLLAGSKARWLPTANSVFLELGQILLAEMEMMTLDVEMMRDFQKMLENKTSSRAKNEQNELLTGQKNVAKKYWQKPHPLRFLMNRGASMKSRLVRRDSMRGLSCSLQ